MNQPIQTRHTVVTSIVDDDDSVRSAIKSLLRSSGYKVQTYCSASEFLETNGARQTDCLISDIQMPGMNGLELHKQLVRMGIHLPTLFITAYPEAFPPMLTDSPALMAYLPKPCDPDRLLNFVKTALHSTTDI
ncbi:response regulator [Pseudomonas syringae]|nr:response regulator [Pseudomonas syringae]MCF5071002.1 response regulator [Pseudomonas syringae]